MVEQLIPRRKFRIKSREFGNQWQIVSYQKNASDVELTGGETVQHRIDNLVAIVTELTETITNLKTTEGQTHQDLENELNLLEDELRSGLRSVETDLLNRPVEGEGAEDFNRLKTATETLKTQTEQRLDDLQNRVRSLLDFELDNTIDIEDYLGDRIDALRDYIESVIMSLNMIIGDGDLYDVFYGIEGIANQNIVEGLKIQHDALKMLTSYYNSIGNMAPPYTWEKYDFSSSVGDNEYIRVETTNNAYVDWHFVFYYLPVFKLLKVTGYVNLHENNGNAGVKVHVLNKKLKFLYADTYQTMVNVYSELKHEDNIFIDHSQGVLLTDPNKSEAFGFGYWDGETGIKRIDAFGISIGDDTDVQYMPSGFNVWSSGANETINGIDEALSKISYTKGAAQPNGSITYNWNTFILMMFPYVSTHSWNSFLTDEEIEEYIDLLVNGSRKDRVYIELCDRTTLYAYIYLVEGLTYNDGARRYDWSIKLNNFNFSCYIDSYMSSMYIEYIKSDGTTISFYSSDKEICLSRFEECSAEGPVYAAIHLNYTVPEEEKETVRNYLRDKIKNNNGFMDWQITITPVN